MHPLGCTGTGYTLASKRWSHPLSELRICTATLCPTCAAPAKLMTAAVSNACHTTACACKLTPLAAPHPPSTGLHLTTAWPRPCQHSSCLIPGRIQPAAGVVQNCSGMVRPASDGLMHPHSRLQGQNSEGCLWALGVENEVPCGEQGAGASTPLVSVASTGTITPAWSTPQTELRARLPVLVYGAARVCGSKRQRCPHQ